MEEPIFRRTPFSDTDGKVRVPHTSKPTDQAFQDGRSGDGSQYDGRYHRGYMRHHRASIQAAVPKSDVSATVPLFIAAKLNPDDAASMSPEKQDINNVLRLKLKPFCAIKIRKSPSMPLNMLL